MSRKHENLYRHAHNEWCTKIWDDMCLKFTFMYIEIHAYIYMCAFIIGLFFFTLILSADRT